MVIARRLALTDQMVHDDILQWQGTQKCPEHKQNFGPSGFEIFITLRKITYPQFPEMALPTLGRLLRIENVAHLTKSQRDGKIKRPAPKLLSHSWFFLSNPLFTPAH